MPSACYSTKPLCAVINYLSRKSTTYNDDASADPLTSKEHLSALVILS